MAAKVSITRFRGDTDPLVFNLTKDSIPLNITGSTFILSVCKVPDPIIPDYTFQITGVITSPTGGVVSFTPLIGNVDLVGTYYYDVQMTTGSVVKTIVTGKITFGQDITK